MKGNKVQFMPNDFYQFNLQTIISTLILIASLYISWRANKTAQESVEKTIKANREEMREESLINLRKDWIQNYTELICRINFELFNIGVITTRINFQEKINSPQCTECLKKIYLYHSELNMKISVDGQRYNSVAEQLKFLMIRYQDFSDKIFENNESYNSESSLLIQKFKDFQKESLKVIEEENSKLLLKV